MGHGVTEGIITFIFQDINDKCRVYWEILGLPVSSAIGRSITIFLSTASFSALSQFKLTLKCEKLLGVFLERLSATALKALLISAWRRTISFVI